MRWMWIDRVVAFEAGRRLVAVKNVSLAEEHLHDHFAADAHDEAFPVMPASLIIEGMAQTAGILVGSTRNFEEKVVLAKIGSAVIESDVLPGQCIRYDATIDRIDEMGANTIGTIERLDHRDGKWVVIGRTEMMFSHLDQNRAGTEFPEENVVFGENFRTLLIGAGLQKAGAGPHVKPHVKPHEKPSATPPASI